MPVVGQHDLPYPLSGGQFASCPLVPPGCCPGPRLGGLAPTFGRLEPAPPRHAIMRTRLLAFTGLLLLAPTAWSCRKAEENQQPVARARLSINQARAALGSPVELTYQFVVASTAP